MEVLVGPTFSIEVSSSPPAAFVVPNSSSQDKHRRGIFLEEDEVGGSGISSRIGSGIGINNGPEESSDSSSSIGAPDDSEDEEEGEEVESVGLSKGSLDSLEESLPIKRGLSNHFTGKSKSFTNLSEVSCVSTVKDLEKPENPFSKRRRLLLANKWCRKSSFYSWANPKSMPLLTLNEEEEEDDDGDVPEPQQLDTDDDEEEQEDNYQATPSSSSSEQDVLRNHQLQKLSKFQDKKFKASFKSHSCFSLADLQDQPFQ